MKSQQAGRGGMMARYGPVVCGVDGSDASRQAASYAAREALVRQLPLRIVHASAWLRPGLPGMVDRSSTVAAALHRQVDALLADAADRAREVAPGLIVDTEIVPGTAAAALIGMSRVATLSVVGSRGLGAVTSLVAGSVSVQVAAHAHCPVIVVRHARHLTAPELPDQPVVVGIDGPRSRPAVDFAFQSATVHGVPLIALHAWTGVVTIDGDRALPLVDDIDAAHQARLRFLTEELIGPSQHYPQVKVERQVVEGPARHALIEESSRAGLLVVGSRGREGFPGLHLGSVSHAMLHHAHCPVAVVRSPQ